MNKNKKTLLLVLVFVLLLGGAYILYNQLSGQVARDSIVVTQEAGSISGTQETQAPEASPQAEEETPAETEAPAQEEAPAAPDFTVLDTDGQEVRLSDMQGTPVVLNFWASWCPPCKSEMPDFEEASKTYEGKVAFMMVNLTDGGRETVDTAKAYIEEQGYTSPFTSTPSRRPPQAMGWYPFPPPISSTPRGAWWPMARARWTRAPWSRVSA